MFKWIKLINNQYFGFWFLGIVLFAIQEIPYMIMPFVKLESNPIMNMTETSEVLNILEKVLGSLCIALIIFIVNQETRFFDIGTGIQKIAFIAMIIVILLNFFGWILYFKGYQSIPIMMFFIVLLPPLYYICIGIWRKNWILVCTGTLFLFVHFKHVYNNISEGFN